MNRNCLLTTMLFVLSATVSLSLLAGQRTAPLPPDYSSLAHQLKDIGLKEERAFEFLRLLTSVGGRLTGSRQVERAVELASHLMTELRLDEVRKEPVTVNRWVRGQVERAVLRSRKLGKKKVNISALGNSVPTRPGGLTAGVLEVHSFGELADAGPRAKGKVVFYNVPMDRTLLDAFSAYGRAAAFRVRGASEAARHGGVASLSRSPTWRLDSYPRTGLMTYDENYPKIPAAAISPEDAETLHRWLGEDPELQIELELDCHSLPPVLSANLLGQLTGLEKPEEVILLGGHIDSWDLGEGAHDDGAGCAVAIEALRLIKALGLEPARTIRAVLFMDEEFGGSGGRAYAQSDNREKEKHLVAFEQDRGGFLPLGLAMSDEVRGLKKLKPLEKILGELGIHWLKKGGGGVDIAPLATQGVVLGSIIPDSQEYFDFHHSARDVLNAVHPRQLELQAIILALVAYFFAQEGL